jgi:hypothetical protein
VDEAPWELLGLHAGSVEPLSVGEHRQRS